MQNGTYPWMASSSLTQKSWPPGYQASLTDLFLKKNPLHFSTGISQLAAASSYIEKMSTINENVPPKCPHPDAKDKPYPCDICQQYLNLCNTLRTESTSVNNNNNNNNNNMPRMTSSPIMTNSPVENKPMNLMPNSSVHSIPTSMQSMHPPSNQVALPMPNMSMNKPRPLPTKQYPCPVCHKFFTQKGNLKTHMMIHTGEKPYSCHACGKCFTQKGNVDTHMKIHTGEREYSCEACGKRFTQKGNLKTHIRSVHTKEKPFACGLCGKSFSQKGNMQTHIRTHNKDDRFPCTLCGKTFSQKGNLKTHMQRHAGQIPTKRQFGSRLANRTFANQLMKPVHPPSSHIPSFPIQASPVPSQASTTSPLRSPTTPQPMSTPNQNNRHSDIRSPRHGLGQSYADSPLDLKPLLNSHLPISRPLSCNQNQLRNSPSPHHSQISSPSPEEEEEHSPPFLPSKLFHNMTNLQAPHHLNEPMSQMHIHNNLISNSQQSARITSPLPVPTPGHMSNHEHDPRPFYSAPPTPVPGPMPPVSRWLPHGPTRHFDSFQSHAGLGYSPIAPTTTPLSRLSLLASGSMNSHHNSIENNEDEHPKKNGLDQHPQEHYQSPVDPDFSQLLD